MRPRIVEYLDRVLDTQVFDYLVPYPALIYALAMLICLIVFARRAKYVHLSQYHAIGALVTGMACGLIGARLLFIIIYQRYYSDIIGALFSFTGATMSWGAYVGGIMGFIGYLWIKRVNILPYLDLAASVLGLGVCIGRISCLLNGCDFGKISNLPWAVSFPAGSIPYVDQVSKGMISTTADLSLSLHPVQLYLSFNGLLLFLIFSYLWKKRNFKPGALFLIYWMTYSITRFTIEFFRGDSSEYYFNLFTFGQLTSLIILLVCSAIVALFAKLNSEIDFKLEN